MLVSAEKDRAVVLERPKLAVAVGTVAGFQLAAVLKSPEPGLASQVAFCAHAGGAVDIMPIARLAASSVNRRTSPIPRVAMPPRPTPIEVAA